MEYTDTVEGLQAEIERLSELNVELEERIEYLEGVIGEVFDLVAEV